LLSGLLLVVAAAAAVLSFAALRDLARLCGFADGLAWLLPVVVDAGAASGSLVWLGGRADAPARRFARALALALLILSVAANALGHGLEAYRLSPPWWVVVAVSAVAPAVLGAVVHLAVLVGRNNREDEGRPLEVQALADRQSVAPTYGAGEFDTKLFDEHGWSRLWNDAPPQSSGADRAAVLIAAGVGRRRLARELGMSEYEARQLLAESRRNHSSEINPELERNNGHTPAPGTDPGFRQADLTEGERG
jgi:hypothetical protein